MGVAGLGVLSIGLSWVHRVLVVAVHGAGGRVEARKRGAVVLALLLQNLPCQVVGQAWISVWGVALWL